MEGFRVAEKVIVAYKKEVEGGETKIKSKL